MFFILALIPVYIILYKIYIPRVNAFGCFDDCFNYLGGFFIANGKHIYSDFFFNHQPIPAFLSFIIQVITHPINIFELLLRHRQFILLWGFLFNVLLVVRFRAPAFMFVLTYELSKFYVFGDRFLAESIIVYPVVYLAGILFSKLDNHKLSSIDYTLSAIFAWFIIFSREPYIPLALLLFTAILFGKFHKVKKLSIAIFVVLSGLIILYISDLKEYFFNLVTFNYVAVLPDELNTQMFGPKPIQIFFYPLYVFFYGGWNIFKQLLIGINILFLIYFVLLIKDRFFKPALFIFVLLGISNFRFVLPGHLFYESFHMITWYSLFIFVTFFLIFNYSRYKLLRVFSLVLIILLLVSHVTSKFYFANEKVDQHFELLVNFGEVMSIGEVVKILSNDGDTLFLDRSDDLIYWQAKRLSPYKYTWYTSQMNHFSKYTSAREEMFKNNPPDFYKEFGSCPKKVEMEDASLPKFIKSNYSRLYSNKLPSCLFVHKKKVAAISTQQWQKAKSFSYEYKP